MNRAVLSRLRRIAAVLAVVAATAAPAAAQAPDTEQVDRTIPFQPGGTLRLKNFSGEVRITGTDASEVTVHAVRRAPRERLDRIKLRIDASDRTIDIQANDQAGMRREKDNVVETTFEIRVPRRTSLDVECFSSPVTADDLDGRHTVHTFSGELRLTRLRGPVNAKTFSAGIHLDAIDGGHELDLESFSGSIELRLPPDARADIRMNTFSGDLRTDMPITLVSQSRRDLHAQLNGGGSDVRVKTFSGDVRLGR
jgi:DUF4097 and DUF4098 domain-containing protein YvlB